MKFGTAKVSKDHKESGCTQYIPIDNSDRRTLVAKMVLPGSCWQKIELTEGETDKR